MRDSGFPRPPHQLEKEMTVLNVSSGKHTLIKKKTAFCNVLSGFCSSFSLQGCLSIGVTSLFSRLALREGPSHRADYFYIDAILLGFLPPSNPSPGLCFPLDGPMVLLKYRRSFLMKMLV